jgi:hypothetical protein
MTHHQVEHILLDVVAPGSILLGLIIIAVATWLLAP